MLTKENFSDARIITLSNLSNLVDFCGDLRKKYPHKKFIVHIKKGRFCGNIIFPYSNFYLIGETENPILEGKRYAKMVDEKGQELTTWKTATLKILGNNNLFENLTIENSAEDPAIKGQEVAVGIYGNHNTFVHCTFISTQDTLFLGPLPDDLVTRYIGFLPDEERYYEGQTRNTFVRCLIKGSVDFIFGAGDADFYQSTFESIDDGRQDGEAYVAAPAHSLKDTYGFFFDRCQFLSSEKPQQSVYLARPWRDYGKCVFYECHYGDHIKKEGFSEWNHEARWRTARFEEYPLKAGRVNWVKNSKENHLPARYQMTEKSLIKNFDK